MGHDHPHELDRCRSTRHIAPQFWSFGSSHLQAPVASVLKVAVDIDLFSKIRDGPQSLETLAESTGTDPVLLSRCLRLLVATGIVSQDEKNHYGSSELSNALATDEKLQSGIIHRFDVLQPVFSQLPQYLRETKYANPSPPNGPWQSVIDENVPYFEWLKSHPTEAKVFNSVMAGYTSQRPRWTNILPAEHVDSLLKSARAGDPLLVDIGGGMGQDIEAFRTSANVAQGLVLQDQPQVIEQAKKRGLDGAITAMPYDFFQPQPVVGAKIYFMHNVLHDWPDAQVVAILKNIRQAMKPGYSRLLLNDAVLYEGRNHPLCASADLLMMSLFCAKERSRSDWERLLCEAELSILKIWTIPEIPESLIEVHRPQE